jgi:transcriptional regulator of arginine metabolism
MHTESNTVGFAARSSEERRETLKRIIRSKAVGRQTELVHLLKKAGHDVTQSSVSRDLRDLGVAKVGDRYMLADDTNTTVAGLDTVAAFIQDAAAAGPHLTVVRTTVGSAQTVAAAIDRARWQEVVGTISGDDTIFIATADGRAQRALLDRLRSFQNR